MITGQLVRLRNGGAVMVVHSVDGVQVTCDWHDYNYQAQRQTYNLLQLIEVSNDKSEVKLEGIAVDNFERSQVEGYGR